MKYLSPLLIRYYFIKKIYNNVLEKTVTGRGDPSQTLTYFVALSKSI